MKFRKFGRVALALAVSSGAILGVTSCQISTNYMVGYMWVTGAQYNQIAGYRIDNNLGQLSVNPNSPYGSGGVNPIQEVVTTAGKFLYVLNAGCGAQGQAACPAGIPANQGGPVITGPSSPVISLFNVGGKGSLSFQQNYTSEGNLPIALMADPGGKFLFVLDSVDPNISTCVATANTVPCGDISVFNIDQNTGRLSAVTNLQVKAANGTNLPFFPLGSKPIFLAEYSTTYIYTIEQGSGLPGDPLQAIFVYALDDTTGQLTLTQNTPIPTGATDLTYIYASASYVYALDAGNGTTAGTILPYTAGTNGALQALVGGAVPNTGTTAGPSSMVVDHTNKFLYVANSGPNLTPSSPASSVTAFFITPVTGQLVPLATGAAGNSVPFGAGSSPRCILEDPSNQYLYTANYDTSTVTGAIVNQEAGTLTSLRKLTSFTTVGQPTWCVVSGTLF